MKFGVHQIARENVLYRSVNGEWAIAHRNFGRIEGAAVVMRRFIYAPDLSVQKYRCR